MRKLESVVVGLVIGVGTMCLTFVVDWLPLLTSRDSSGVTGSLAIIDGNALFRGAWLLAFLVAACWTAWASADRRAFVLAVTSWLTLLLVSALFWWISGGLRPAIAFDWWLLASCIAAIVGARVGVGLAQAWQGPRARASRLGVALAVVILGFTAAYRSNPPFWSPVTRAALARVEIPMYPGGATTPRQPLPTARIAEYALGPEVTGADVLAFYDQRLATMGWIPSGASAHPELGPVDLRSNMPGIYDRAWHDREGRLHLEVVIQPPRSPAMPQEERTLVVVAVRPMWTVATLLALRQRDLR